MNEQDLPNWVMALIGTTVSIVVVAIFYHLVSMVEAITKEEKKKAKGD